MDENEKIDSKEPKSPNKPRYLFKWDEIPGNDKEKLIEFLIQKFCICWIKTAKIEKIDNGKTIRISTDKNYLSLTLNNEKTKVNLKIDDGRTYKFFVETEDGKLNIYKPSFGGYVEVFFRIIGGYIGSSAWRAVITFSLVGFIVSYNLKLTMNSDTWFWFFSSIAQTFAALVALVAIFIISRLELYNIEIGKSKETIAAIIKDLIPEGKQDFVVSDSWLLNKATQLQNSDEQGYRHKLMRKELKNIEHLKQKKETTKKQMRILLEHAVIIIMLSITLIPFGSLSTENNSILTIWIDYKLKWILISGIAGLCVAALYKVESSLKDILSEKE